MKIILIGFMGCGKSSVGKLISKLTDIELIDIDEEIEKKMNMTITQIFDKYLESGFRDIEYEVLNSILKNGKDNIISTGGGIISLEKSRNLLRNTDNIFYLRASKYKILSNIKDELDNRPILKQSKDLLLDIEVLMDKREDKYLSVANHIIDIDNKNIEEVASQILVQIV